MSEFDFLHSSLILRAAAKSCGRTSAQQGRSWGAAEKEVATVSSDTLIQAMIQNLPEKGLWPRAERDTWTKILAMAFDIAHGPSDDGGSETDNG
jgi:hypothetical protein